MGVELTPTEKRVLAAYVVAGDVHREDLHTMLELNTTYTDKCINNLRERGIIDEDVLQSKNERWQAQW